MSDTSRPRGDDPQGAHDLATDKSGNIGPTGGRPTGGGPNAGNVGPIGGRPTGGSPNAGNVGPASGEGRSTRGDNEGGPAGRARGGTGRAAVGGTAAGTAIGAATVGAVAGTRTHRDRRPGPRGMGHVGEHATEGWWRTWLRRTSAALLATLVLGTGLVWAWVGGLHNPYPRDVPVAVIDGDRPANALLALISRQTNTLEAVGYADPDDATTALSERSVAGILATDNTGPLGGLNLTIAGGAGPGVPNAVAGSITVAANQLGIPLTVEDTHPVAAGDANGRTPFYLMMAWVLSGLLVAVILGIALGTVPRDLDRLGMRLAALAAFCLVVALFGALLAGPILDVWHQHTVGLWLSGSLIIFTAALITSALQSWLGMWGVGVAVLFMVVLGLPGSGGLFGSDLLPGFFRGMHTWLPNGLGTDLIRGLEYFGRGANTWPIAGLGLWSVASILALFAATAVLGRHAREKAWAVAWERDDDPGDHRAGDPTADRAATGASTS